MQKSEEPFSEAHITWDLKKLYADLTKAGGEPLRTNAKTFLRGVLCGYSPKEISEILNYGGKDSGTVRQTLTKEVYPAIKALKGSEQRIDGRRVLQLLENYRKGNNFCPSLEVPWKQVCEDMLGFQKKGLLTSYPIRGANHPSGAVRRIQDVYVPLELVERQPNHRVKHDFDSENFSVREQEEKTKPVSHEEFFNSILKGQSPKSKGNRIAIIGEPGAGKTTLLQAISAKVDGTHIWIDLASLKRDDTLETYLLHNWLKSSQSLIRKYIPEAVPNLLEPSIELEHAFAELFEQNQVWLLLDGADEMSSDLGHPLNWVAQQLQQAGWVANAKVVLTSRLNLWSDYGDRLVEFDTYRNLDFEPEQVDEFIEKWFAEEPNSSQKLKEELERSSDRIKSLIRNPLRLTLLCITWKGVGDRLPETKAGLYQRLVNAHYKWKDDKQEFVIDPDEREQLHQQLGELSKAALDSKESRFRLRQSFIARFLGKPDKKNSLFWWAIKLGWLNQIGLPDADENDADEPVYAFFHPTFQEYFAALAIDDWDDFLPRNHVDKPIENRKGECRYRIFEPQWRETILLWFGYQKDIESRERFIGGLIDFKDGCRELYWYNTYFLAAASITEFDSQLSNRIIEKLINWNFNSLGHGSSLPSYTKVKYEKTLLESHRQKLIKALTVRLSSKQDDLLKTALTLFRVDSSNTIAIEFLCDYLKRRSERKLQGIDFIKAEILSVFRKCSANNSKINAFLAKELPSEAEKGEKPLSINLSSLKLPQWKSDDLNVLIAIDFEEAIFEKTINNLGDIESLIELLKKKPELKVFEKVSNDFKSFIEIINKNDVSGFIVDFVQCINFHAINRIVEIISENPNATSILVQAFNAQDIYVRNNIVWALGKAAPHNSDAIKALLDLLKHEIEEAIGENILFSLKTVFRADWLSLVVNILCKYEGYEVDEVLWHCAQNMTYPDFHRAWHDSSSNEDKSPMDY